MKYISTLIMVLMAAACSNTDFAGEQSPRKAAIKPQVNSEPAQPNAEPIPQSTPQITPETTPQWDPLPTNPTPRPENNGPGFWDQAKQWFQGLDFNRGFDFGSGSESFHIGNGDFASSSECSTRLRFSQLSGRTFKFQFQVTEPNTTVNIKIDRICGVDRTNNLVKLFNGGYEMQQHRKNLRPGQDDFEFQQMVLQPGWYEIQVISPDFDLNGSNDPDDFLVGKVKVRADKLVNKGQILTVD